ncbi:hypothetical protein IGI04_002522 [Brassica rapa subsp. trilocularis]|uniref:Uncharacterized protein n=1 Tax=Brassica rapa subsp. trilocularis TaxID=1813537 RepID=A0ABQ7NXZ3_BRACM|nr:hypothetical protein IGI04_002522 [Brassica rapa subsp. trilocularis]
MRNKSTYYSQISPLILLRYYDDAACMLRKMCLDANAPHLSSTLPPLCLGSIICYLMNRLCHPLYLGSIIERLIMFYLLLLIFINYKIQ